MMSQMLNFHLPRWHELPDYDIYKEQLVYYVTQNIQAILPEDEKSLTPTMVQNYVKWKILPRPNGKKYTREHIVWCIVITLLKKVLSIPEIEHGIHLQMRRLPLDESYNYFCDQLESSLYYCFSAIKQDKETHHFASYTISDNQIAIRSICQAFAFKTLTEQVLLHDGIAKYKENNLRFVNDVESE